MCDGFIPVSTQFSVDESVGQALPSSSLISVYRTHRHTNTGNQNILSAHTQNVGLGVKWYLEGVNLGSGWRETREGQTTLVLETLCCVLSVLNGCFC